MEDIVVSRRSVLVSAASVAVLPVLGSKARASVGYAPRTVAHVLGSVSSRGKPRYLHTATAMADGRILMAGGYHLNEASRRQTRVMPSASVEIYDPFGNTWTEIAPLSTPRARHAAVLLQDGRVAVMGGYLTAELDSVEIYDPSSGVWTPAAPLRQPMCDHAACVSGSQIVLSGGRLGTAAEIHVLRAASSRPLP